jgi:hypothetical protein
VGIGSHPLSRSSLALPDRWGLRLGCCTAKTCRLRNLEMTLTISLAPLTPSLSLSSSRSFSLWFSHSLILAVCLVLWFYLSLLISLYLAFVLSVSRFLSLSIPRSLCLVLSLSLRGSLSETLARSLPESPSPASESPLPLKTQRLLAVDSIITAYMAHVNKESLSPPQLSLTLAYSHYCLRLHATVATSTRHRHATTVFLCTVCSVARSLLSGFVDIGALLSTSQTTPLL